MGKGSDQRKSQVPQKQIADSWDRIFGKQRDKPVKSTN